MPPLVIVAWNDWSEPSSTEEETGESETATSLVIATTAVEDLEESARLVAVTWTEPPDGRSAGPVKSPSGEMVPVCGEPPAMPFTLQETEVSEVLVTVAVKASVLPSSTLPELGAMVTVICGGGGVVEPPPPPPPHAARARASRNVDWVEWRRTRRLRAEGPSFERECERGRMAIVIADEGPAKTRGGAKAANQRLEKICFL